MSGPLVLTITQINTYLKSQFESDERLAHCFAVGEISNLTDHYASGHIYLSLKDEQSVIRAVMFASAARRLKFRPCNGMRVLVRGRITVYEPQGQYQFYIEDMQPDGVGARALALEQLKAKLQKEGLFDSDRKRPLPLYPQRIAVVTSPTGAAVRDILQITARRWPLAQIDLYGVLVQGEQAPAQIAEAIYQVGKDAKADLVIVGRGGGSAEDLWAFNDEQVVRAVAACPIPVVSAVGHETDFTLCDFAADLRAPTPSAAAELCTPDWQEELQRVTSARERMAQLVKDEIENARMALDVLTTTAAGHHPKNLVDQQYQKLDLLVNRMQTQMRHQLQLRRERFGVQAARLDALSPLRVLGRGYAVVYKDEKAVSKAEAISRGDSVRVRMADGELLCTVEDTVTHQEKEGKYGRTDTDL